MMYEHMTDQKVTFWLFRPTHICPSSALRNTALHSFLCKAKVMEERMCCGRCTSNCSGLILWEVRVEMRKKGRVRKVSKARGIICHWVGWAWHVIMVGNVAMWG